MKRRRQFPRPLKGCAWVYLIGRPNGDVKLGMTSDPQKRMATHRHGATTWRHYCAYGTRSFALEAERAAIRVLLAAGATQRGGPSAETFTGINRGDAIDAVREAVAWVRENLGRIERRRASHAEESAAWKQFRAHLLTDTESA